ncbi:hypothetical protein EC968_007827 [Mortierella alpina]|nr:hypothetical protein EC968_007827 [Mortierella alpina]
MDPLSIPELLSLICCHLDKHTLASGSLVCRAWSHICTRLLWESCSFTPEQYGTYHSTFDDHAHLIYAMVAEQRLIGRDARFIAHQCINLSDLKLRSCYLIPASLDVLFDGILKVKRLTLELCRGVNSSIAPRLARLPLLHDLDITVHTQERGNGDWREDDMVLLLTGCRRLRSLKIFGPDLSHIHLLGLKRQSVSLGLVNLELVWTFISGNALTVLLGKSPSLSSLILLHNASKNSTVQAIAQSTPRLQVLGLRNSTSISTAAFDSVFKNQPALVQLDLSKTLIHDAAVIMLAQSCGQLQDLNLSGCSRVTTAAFLRMVAMLGRLRALRVSGCTKLGREAFLGLTPWASSDTLQELQMASVGIRAETEALDGVVSLLCSLKRLRQLWLDTAVSQHVAVCAYVKSAPGVYVAIEDRVPNRC